MSSRGREGGGRRWNGAGWDGAAAAAAAAWERPAWERPIRVVYPASTAKEWLFRRLPGPLEGPSSPRHEALLAGAWKDSSGPQSATWSGRQLWGWKSGLSAGGAAGSGLARVLAARLRTMCPRRSSHVGLRHRGVRGAVEKRESSFGEPLARHVSGRNGHPARRGRREKSTAADIWWRPTSSRGC